MNVAKRHRRCRLLRLVDFNLILKGWDTFLKNSVSSMKLRGRLKAAFFVAVVALSSMAVVVPADAQGNYDVVITNGRVLDPETGLDAVRNVGITAGIIQTIPPEP